MIKKEILVELYVDKKMSMSEIAKELAVSTNKVDWWMRKHGLDRRSRSNAGYIKNNPDGDPFRISNIDSNKKAFLYGLGLGLFWGEGNKVSKESLRLGNTDVRMIKTYVYFLKDICGVKNEKIRFGLQVFNDSDPKVAMQYWVDMLGVPRERFMKTISIVPPQGKGSYRRKNRYGVVTVYVNNVKLVDWMHLQIKNIDATLAQW